MIIFIRDESVDYFIKKKKSIFKLPEILKCYLFLLFICLNCRGLYLKQAYIGDRPLFSNSV